MGVHAACILATDVGIDSPEFFEPSDRRLRTDGSFDDRRITAVSYLFAATHFREELSMRRKTVVAALTCALIFLAVGAMGAAAAPLSLLLPQSTAFSILGHSCGGIQEQAFATGFDPTSGYPTGDVYLQTRCGGSGRGGGYHTTTYSAWVGATWDFAGGVRSADPSAAFLGFLLQRTHFVT